MPGLATPTSQRSNSLATMALTIKCAHPTKVPVVSMTPKRNSIMMEDPHKIYRQLVLVVFLPGGGEGVFVLFCGTLP